MSEETLHESRLATTTETTQSALMRRLEIWICVLFAGGLVVLCTVFFVWRPADDSLFRHLLEWLSGAWFVSLAIIYLVVRIRLLKINRGSGGSATPKRPGTQRRTTR